MEFLNDTFDYHINWKSRGYHPGQHKSDQRGMGIEFAGHATIIDYPDPRRIDIRQTIRDPFEQVQVRIFNQRSATPIVIASDLSAKMYNLKILEKNIEDEKGNVTRFLIMGKNIEQPEYIADKKFITSCIFRVKSEPSALYKCLGGFATNQVNLTKLESFSVKNTFDQANFYLDLEGHLEQSGVKKALEELGFHTETLDILGVYESSTFRQK